MRKCLAGLGWRLGLRALFLVGLGLGGLGGLGLGLGGLGLGLGLGPAFAFAGLQPHAGL